MKTVGILGKGEIGGAMFRIAQEAGFNVLIRELGFDELKGERIDFLHVNIPEGENSDFVKVVTKTIREIDGLRLVVINSSVTPGTTRKIFEKTKVLIVHSPVIGVHPELYNSIKFYFPKIIGPVNKLALTTARKHFKNLGLTTEIYHSCEDSETAKLIDLIYYAWNIVFCKWVDSTCEKLKLNFDDVYTKHNMIYNSGYSKLIPNAVRPILFPIKGQIGGHCVIPDTILFHRFFRSRLTQFILEEDEKYKKEVKTKNVGKLRKKFIKIRDEIIKRNA